MAALQIQPHSRRVSRAAVAGLAVLAASAFTLGVTRQMLAAGPSPFPPAQPLAAKPAAAVPEASPALDMQLAAAPIHRRATKPLADETPVPDATSAAPADSAVGTDASANAPAPADSSAPPAAPNPAPDPTPTAPPDDSDTAPPT